jgi:Zn-finger nucleic acid-binding protein
MMPKCPKCRENTLCVLNTGQLLGAGEDEPAYCSECRGIWLSAGDFEYMASAAEGKGGAKSSKVNHDADAEAFDSEDLDNQVGACPYNHGILTRAPAPLGGDFHLEQCPVCKGVWFDQGEFDVVYSLKMFRLLPNLWDPVHRSQTALSAEKGEHLEDVRERLGSELFERLTALADDLRGHRFRTDAMAYLNERLMLVSLVEND